MSKEEGFKTLEEIKQGYAPITHDADPSDAGNRQKAKERLADIDG